MDARVSRALLAMSLTACIGSGGDPIGPGSEQACRPMRVDVGREGSSEIDASLWDIEIETPHGIERCSASRGGWLCSNPRTNGRSRVPETVAERGLPRDAVLLFAMDDGAEGPSYRYTVRRNGVIRYQGPAVCGSAPCGAGNPNFNRTLPLGGAP